MFTAFASLQFSPRNQAVHTRNTVPFHMALTRNSLLERGRNPRLIPHQKALGRIPEELHYLEDSPSFLSTVLC
jgi:hypothetical protein